MSASPKPFPRGTEIAMIPVVLLDVVGSNQLQVVSEATARGKGENEHRWSR